MTTQQDFNNWPGCRECKHFMVNKGRTPLYSCAAFPDGIPMEHASGTIPHVTPTPKQSNNIVFESKE